MTFEKEKWLKIHDGQYEFKVLFILYADCDEKFREKIYQIKAERNCKTPYAEKINTHVLSRSQVCSTFACENVLYPL